MQEILLILGKVKILIKLSNIKCNLIYPLSLIILSHSSFSQVPKVSGALPEGYTEIKTNIPISTYVFGFINSVSVISVNNEKYYLVDSLGNLINKEPFEYINIRNCDNYFIARKDGKFGVLSSKAEAIIPFTFTNYFSDWGTE